MLHGGDIYNKNIICDFSVNLNPLPCPQAVTDALYASLKHADRYPDLYQRDFREAVAKAEGVSPSCVIGGNGASELLMSAVRLINPENALIITPAFEGYRHILSAVEGCRVSELCLSEADGFALDEAVLDMITPELSLIILNNPNNPVGRSIAPGLMDKLLERCIKTGTFVIADESFLHLSSAATSLIPYTGEYDRLYVISAYTKLFSLPGVRIGYCIAGERSIESLKKQLPEWNMSVMAQETGAAAAGLLSSGDYKEKTIAAVSNERDFLTNALKEKGIKVYPSDTCYIMIKCDRPLYSLMLEKGIMIRNLSSVAGLGRGYYRIAVKEHEANELFVKTLNNIT